MWHDLSPAQRARTTTDGLDEVDPVRRPRDLWDLMKIGANEACPCGSGRKYKKCCNGPSATNVPYSRTDREQAMFALEEYGTRRFPDDEHDAGLELFGPFADRVEALPSHYTAMVSDLAAMWFGLDFALEEGGSVVGHLLADPAVSLRPGARAYLHALSRTSMRLYDVTDLVPGVSITVRDAIEGGTLVLTERTASRTLSRGDALAARIIARGCTGRPELERGVLSVPSMSRDALAARLSELREEELHDVHDGDAVAFYRQCAPEIAAVFLAAIFEPQVPDVLDHEGEIVLPTQVSFFVDDDRKARWLLDRGEAIGIAPAAPNTWGWVPADGSAGERRLANLSIEGGVLTAELMSAKRAEQLRALLQGHGGAVLRHRATVHQDLRRAAAELITRRALREADDDTPDGEGDLPERRADAALRPEEEEAIVSHHYEKHYRRWVDEAIPALEGHTPRFAARSSALRPKVEELLRGLEHQYEMALKANRAAYDPSWMWAELGLSSPDDDDAPPLLAHERVGERVPGITEAAKAAAERLRSAAWFREGVTTLDDDVLARDLELQRVLRTSREAGNDTGHEGMFAAPYLRLIVNHELYRRKTFWVSSSLSFQLEHTDLALAGDELRLPFRSFALVLADRHALSLAERILAKKKDDPLRGQLLRVATVYVTELSQVEGRVVELVFALDALGADLPSLLRFAIDTEGEDAIDRFLASAGPKTRLGPEVPDRSPERALLRLVLNAILFATGRGPTTDVRAKPRKPSDKALPLRERRSSDAVFHLPGSIDIKSLRTLREIERGAEGRSLLARFLVRGHWRRPARGFHDQRLRWIETYWKGPPMSAIVEKAYRLT